MKSHDDKCKGKALMRQLPFSLIHAVILTLDLLTPKLIGHILNFNMSSLWVKFYNDRCKEKTIMHQLPFSVINAL